MSLYVCLELFQKRMLMCIYYVFSNKYGIYRQKKKDLLYTSLKKNCGKKNNVFFFIFHLSNIETKESIF